jgi:hypothetical protein
LLEGQARTSEYLKGVVHEPGTATHQGHELDPLGKNSNKLEAIPDIRG